jgi:hypothetical protein
MDHPLIGRHVLDEMGFVASQHLDTVQDKFQLQDFSYIAEELLDLGKQHLRALSKLLLRPADIPEFIEDFPNVLLLAKKKAWSVGSRRSRTRLMRTSVKNSRAKLMTGTMTCYSPT